LTQNSTVLHRARVGAIILGIVVAAGGLAVWGIQSRVAAEAVLARTSDDAAVPIVVARPAQAGPADEEVVLPGNVQAEYDTPIYARTSGYVKQWYTDIGAHVKAGDLLADIDSPEVDQQLKQAEADLLTAQANDRFSQATARRVRALLPTQFVSAERDDQAQSDAAAKEASVASNNANVERLRKLVGFERVVAPYDGIVTARETDVGNLINAGSGTGPELFRVADIRKLKIYVQVPQSYAPRVRRGVAVTLQFPEYPGRSFAATLVRTANAINPNSRTLLVELETDNANGQLLPGGYTEVHFKLPAGDRGVQIPANALLFRAEGVRVATINNNGLVALHEVTLGRDFGSTIEVLAGVSAGDMVILNPPASATDGVTVHVRQADKIASSQARP
jgi:RND family efflux transporter MFP subunit